MKKRISILFLSLLLCVLCACGSTEASNERSEQNNEVTNLVNDSSNGAAATKGDDENNAVDDFTENVSDTDDYQTDDNAGYVPGETSEPTLTDDMLNSLYIAGAYHGVFGYDATTGEPFFYCTNLIDEYIFNINEMEIQDSDTSIFYGTSAEGSKKFRIMCFSQEADVEITEDNSFYQQFMVYEKPAVDTELIGRYIADENYFDPADISVSINAYGMLTAEINMENYSGTISGFTIDQSGHYQFQAYDYESGLGEIFFTMYLDSTGYLEYSIGVYSDDININTYGMGTKVNTHQSATDENYEEGSWGPIEQDNSGYFEPDTDDYCVSYLSDSYVYTDYVNYSTTASTKEYTLYSFNEIGGLLSEKHKIVFDNVDDAQIVLDNYNNQDSMKYTDIALDGTIVYYTFKDIDMVYEYRAIWNYKAYKFFDNESFNYGQHYYEIGSREEWYSKPYTVEEGELFNSYYDWLNETEGNYIMNDNADKSMFIQGDSGEVYFSINEYNFTNAQFTDDGLMAIGYSVDTETWAVMWIYGTTEDMNVIIDDYGQRAETDELLTFDNYSEFDVVTETVLSGFVKEN